MIFEIVLEWAADINNWHTFNIYRLYIIKIDIKITHSHYTSVTRMSPSANWFKHKSLVET